MKQQIRDNQFNQEFINENMMGPSAVLLIEELTKDLPLKPGMKVLDLGCGRGVTSIFLAKKFGVQVYAVDLWTTATDNFNRFKQVGVEDLIIPLQVDALQLPFAEKYFDAVVSVDSYHYFANNNTYFHETLKPLLKQDGIVAISFPGMKHDVYDQVPEEMKPYWDKDFLEMVRSIEWWKPKFEAYLSDFRIYEMQSTEEAWKEWLATENPYAIEDRAMMAADGGRYINSIALTGRA